MEGSNTPLDEKTLFLPADGGVGTEPDEVTGLRAAIWRRELDLMDARGEIAELRQSVAILTSAGAELAAALGTRDATIAAATSPVFLSEVGDIGASVAALQVDVDDANARRLEIEGRLGERDAELYRLEDQLAAAQAETEWMAAGKAELETSLQAQARGWDDVRSRLAAIGAELQPEQQEPVAGTAAPWAPPGEEAAAEEVPVAGPDAVFGEIARVTAGIAALRLALQQKDEALAASARASAPEAEPVAGATSGSEVEAPASASDTEIAGLQAELTRVQTELNQTKEESAKADEARVGEIAALTAAAAASAKTIRDKDAEMEEAKSTVADLEQQNAKLSAEVQQLKSEPEGGHLKRIAGLTAVAVSASKLLGGDAEEDTKAAAEPQAEPQTGPQDVADQDAELASLRAELDALRLSFDAVSSEKDAAQTQVQQQAAELAAAQAKLASAEPAPNLPAEPSTAGEVAPSRVAAKTAPIQAALISGVRPQTTAIVQDLAALKGIGPVYEQRLYDRGIGTFWEVANLSNEEFVDFLKPNRAGQSQLDFQAIRADALRLARETFSMGHIWDGAAVDDLQRIEGVGQVMEQRLYDAGVHTFEQLAAITLEQLSAIIGDSEPFNPDFTDWINQARALVAQHSRS